MRKALAIQINRQFAGGTGIMQVEHTTDCVGGASLKSPLSTEVWHPRHICQSSSSSRMRVINHNWSATKKHLHPQSVAEISRHSVLSGDRNRQCETLSGLATRTQISVCKLPFPSAGIAVSLFRAKTVQQRSLLPREGEARLPDCGITN